VGNQNCEDTHAIFRVVSSQMDPDVVGRKLGLEADFVRSTASSPLKFGVWSITSKGRIDSTDLEDHLVYVLDRLQSAGVTGPVEVGRDTRVEFHCYWMSATGQGGPVLSAAVLRRIADLAADLDFDFYSAV
jgi:hypothetical protein